MRWTECLRQWRLRIKRRRYNRRFRRRVFAYLESDLTPRLGLTGWSLFSDHYKRKLIVGDVGDVADDAVNDTGGVNARLLCKFYSGKQTRLIGRYLALDPLLRAQGARTPEIVFADVSRELRRRHDIGCLVLKWIDSTRDAAAPDAAAILKNLALLHAIDADRIDRMIVIAGPTAAGKSTLIERLMDGRGGAVAAACEYDRADGWIESNAILIRKASSARCERMIYHYDLLRPWRNNARVYRNDEGLDPLGCADRVRVVTLLARPATMIERVERELAGLEPRQERKRERLQAVVEFYRHPDRLVRQIQLWIDYCKPHGAMQFVDTTAEPRVVAGDRWKSVLE
jgi:hypothetical protein